MHLPVVAIVGRPNVGKSTLFNRLLQRRLAIVDDQPGVTRDRLNMEAEWLGRRFMLIDTGGLVPEAEDRMERIIKVQVEIALEEADLIVFVAEAHTGPTPQDREIADILQRVEKPVILVINKVDNDTLEADANEFYELGMGVPCPVSALGGRNTGDLLDLVVAGLPAKNPSKDDADILKIAIVGKPNVGKSSLLNALTGENRVIVDNAPGTTRDSIDTEIRYKGERIIITDTAGIRRKRKMDSGVEYYSSLRALKSISRCDVALILINAREMVCRQDQLIINAIIEAGKGIILLVNQWDLIEKDNETHKEFTADIRDKLGRLHYIPIEYISATKGLRIHRPLEIAKAIKAKRQMQYKTAALNKLLEEICALRNLFTVHGKAIKVNYMTQVGNEPPCFLLFTNYPRDMRESDKRFFERNIRRKFDFEGTPIILVWRQKN